MFKDIGGKMKFFAEAMAWIGIIISIGVGLLLCATGIGARKGESLIIGGILLMSLGSIASYIGSWFLYGFGELIENSRKQTELLLRIDDGFLGHHKDLARKIQELSQSIENRERSALSNLLDLYRQFCNYQS